MIDGLDLVLRRILVAADPALAQPGHLSFQPPNEAWRQRVESGLGLWLNCALVDLREDRHRRSTEVRVERNPLRRSQAPFLLRCHYLISAWNSATDSESVDATGAEHALLGKVVATLLEHAPLTPSAVLVPGELASLAQTWREASFDTDVLPPEGFPKLAEFWGNQGRAAGWRPSVWLIITVPVTPAPIELGGIVTTVITGLGVGVPHPDFAETVTDVGGLVTDVAGDPLIDALVTVTDPNGRLCARDITTADGHFVITNLPPGTYQISARSAAHPPLPPVPLTVPSATAGPLQLQFT